MNKCRGFGLFEIIIGVSIIALVIGGGFMVVQSSSIYQAQAADRVRAELLLQEGAEVVRLIRDTDWGLLAVLQPDRDYWFLFSNGVWSVSNSATPDLFQKFDRRFQVKTVERDASGNIVSSGGVVDPHILRADVSVQWESGDDAKSSIRTVYVAQLF